MAQNDRQDEIVRLEKTLSQLEADLQACYTDMGKSLMELAGQEQKRVNELVDGIIAARKRLSLAKNEIECETCTAFNPPDARYCKRCGRRLSPGGKTKNKENEYGTQ